MAATCRALVELGDERNPCKYSTQVVVFMVGWAAWTEGMPNASSHRLGRVVSEDNLPMPTVIQKASPFQRLMPLLKGFDGPLAFGIFLLAWPLEWVPIVLIVVPFVVPIIDKLGFDLAWFGILVAVCLQTAWLSPPVAMSAYFLKGVVPEWDLGEIYKGMMQFMGLQILGLIIIVVFPEIVLWLPRVLEGG